MPIKAPVGYFDMSELRSLKWAYSRACKDLGIGLVPTQGGVRRERLAKIIFRIAGDGEKDPEAIRRRAAMHFKGAVLRAQWVADTDTAI